MELFAIHGYDKTPISLILEKTGLSKGGFYHHFKSKEEILDSLAKSRVDKAIQLIENIAIDPDLSAADKFNNILSAMLAFRKKNAHQLMQVYKSYLRNENLQWKNKIDEYTMIRALPYYTSIIEQGIAEGVFKVRFSKFTAETIIREAPQIRMKIAKLYLREKDNPDFNKNIENLANYLDEFIHKVLGAENGLLQIANVFIDFFDEIK